MKHLFLISLVILAQCTQTLNQAGMFDDQLGQLTNSKFGKTILKMINLSQHTDVDFSPLFTSLDDLTTSIQQSKADEAKSLEEAYQQFQSDFQFYTEQVTQYTTESAQHNTDLSTLQQDRTSFQQNLLQSKTQLAQLKQSSAQLSSSMNKNQDETTKKSGEYDQSISIIDQVITKMQSIKANSFLEVTAEDLKLDTNTLHRRLSSVSGKNVFFEPLVEVLLEMSASKFADQEAVGNVIKLLQNLRDDLMASKNTLILGAQTLQNENESMVQAFEAQIAELGDNVIPGLQGDIETKDGQIETKNGLLKDSTSNLDSASANLNQTNENWAKRQGQNKELNEGYDNEMLAISQALVALERGGIRRK